MSPVLNALLSNKVRRGGAEGIISMSLGSAFKCLLSYSAPTLGRVKPVMPEDKLLSLLELITVFVVAHSIV